MMMMMMMIMMMIIIIIIINRHSCPEYTNLAKTIPEIHNKYQDLANEICAILKQNAAQVIPIVISSTGVIQKSLPQSLKRLDLHPNTYTQMQTSVILGTCSVVRNFLNYKQDHRA